MLLWSDRQPQKDTEMKGNGQRMLRPRRHPPLAIFLDLTPELIVYVKGPQREPACRLLTMAVYRDRLSDSLVYHRIACII